MSCHDKTLRDIKAMISNFMQETKSNVVTDLIVWLDCKTEKLKRDEEIHQKAMKIRRNR